MTNPRSLGVFVVACICLIVRAQPAPVPAAASGTFSGAALLSSSTISLTAKDSSPRDARSADDSDTPEDKFLSLEDATDTKTLAWVREHNAATLAELQADAAYAPIRAALLQAQISNDKLPYISRMGELYYNFLQNKSHPRGILRRTTCEEYKKPNTTWELVLDLDALSEAESKSWIWRYINSCTDNPSRALVKLSDGGTDTAVFREFDLDAKEFIAPDKGGFVVPESKGETNWRDRDTLFVSTDFGPDSLTSAGFPRMVKIWKRGTQLSEARQSFTGLKTDLAARAWRQGGQDFAIRTFGFGATNITYFHQNGNWKKIEKPYGVSLGFIQGQFFFRVPSDWTVPDSATKETHTYSANSLLVSKYDDFISTDRNIAVLHSGDERKPLYFIATKNHCVAVVLDNMRQNISAWYVGNKGWSPAEVSAPVGENLFIEIRAEDSSTSDALLITTQNFLTPRTLIRCTPGETEYEILKQEPALFDATGMHMQRYDAISKDGTKVPYFVVTPKNFRADSSTPTILYGYGGFGLFSLPSYAPSLGKAWLERGGAYVVACIRGGGEFGIKWHHNGVRQYRQNGYDDFAAVAQDLIARKITSSEHLGIIGHSTGGQLVAASLIQHPELFRAAVSTSPLLDMRRYTKLLLGKIWISENGDPDKPEDWSFMKKISPYHLVMPASQVKYPRVLFTTASNDDRVHPGHARKMAALMQTQGHDVLYYESTGGGHIGFATTEESIAMNTLTYTFFSKELGLDSRN